MNSTDCKEKRSEGGREKRGEEKSWYSVVSWARFAKLFEIVPVRRLLLRELKKREYVFVNGFQPKRDSQALRAVLTFPKDQGSE